MHHFWSLLIFLALPICDATNQTPRMIPQLPKQFSARLEITAHAVDRTKEYPPGKRNLDIWYDAVVGRAKVVVRDGLSAGKTYLRLFDSKKEYMIRGGEYASCRRSYLGEIMPSSELPSTISYQGEVIMSGTAFEHWFQDDRTSRVHVYVDREGTVPRILTEEALKTDAPAVPVMTYDFREISVGPQASELFHLPREYESVGACDLHVGGFPYLHLFHHYLRV